jgi:hypothetical protein
LCDTGEETVVEDTMKSSDGAIVGTSGIFIEGEIVSWQIRIIGRIWSRIRLIETRIEIR